MHELSVMQALLHEIETVAATHRATSVRRVTVQIGPLSGVDSGSLQSAFEASRGLQLIARADLLLEPTVVSVYCRKCGGESAVTHNRLLCPRCGDYQTTLLTGDELILRRVEFEAEAHV